MRRLAVERFQMLDAMEAEMKERCPVNLARGTSV